MIAQTLLFESELVTLGALVGTIAASYAAHVAAPASTMRRIAWIPEGRLSRLLYSPDDIRACLVQLGAHGGVLYQRQLRSDILFVPTYAAGLTLLLDGTWGRLVVDPQPQILLPAIVVGVADLVEDCLLLAGISRDGSVKDGFARAASLATVSKWISAALTVSAIGIGAAILALRGPDSL